MKKDFAELLSDWRQKHGWTRKEAAEKLGIPFRTMQDWEQRRADGRARRIPSQMAQAGVLARMREIDQTQR
jgi:transcriptional regulator with XRE-family HTH domain